MNNKNKEIRRKYVKPAMRVHELNSKPSLLVGSGERQRYIPQEW